MQIVQEYYYNLILCLTRKSYPMNVKLYPKFIFGSYKLLIKTLLIVFGFMIGTGQYLQGQCSISTVNPSFETPGLPPNTGSGFPDGSIPGWKSSDSSHFIELHSNSVDGFLAYDGTQYAQLQYAVGIPAGVYQNFNTPVPMLLSFSYAHRGENGIDSVGVYEGPPGGPFTLLQKAGDGPGAWVQYSGSFVVPAGQPLHVLLLKPFLFSAGGNGNFLDDVNVTATSGNLTPTFSFLPLAPICQGGAVPVLPTVSDEGVPGTWAPSVISNTTSGSYVFTPNAGQCAAGINFSTTVNPNTTPTFSIPNSIGNITYVCDGGSVPTLPNISNEGIAGTWSPAVVSNLSSASYTFTPTPVTGQCFNNVTITATVLVVLTPTFTPIASFCKGATPPTLPTTSTNGLAGTWSPAVVDNMASGTYTFTPTPVVGNCFNSFTMSITVNNPVTPTFSFATSICSGSAAPILPASSNEGITGTWSPAVVDNMTSGTYTFTPDVGQCGVPVTIPVTVLMPVTSTVYDTIPQGANYFGHTTTGTYTDTYTAANGCDSVRTLYLVVNPQNCFIPTINPSFETPLAPPGANWFFNDALVPGWKTTEADNEIEVWSSGFLGVPAYDGNQFVELNANAPSGLYQDYNTPTPLTFNFSYAHRGRAGVDVAGVYAGPPSGPYTLLQTATDGNTAWGFHTGSYTVPAGQPVTRFIFQAISENGLTGPNVSVGNFLDDVNFTAQNALLSDSATMNCLTGNFSAVSAGVGNWTAVASNPSPTNISNPTGNNTIINGFGVAGIYKYTWQNASCIDTLVITVNNNPVPVTPTFPEITSFCSGTPSLVLPAVSSEGIMGTWSPATIDNTTSGTYTFTANPGQCPTNPSTLNVTILQPSASTIYDTIPQGGNYDGYTTSGTYVDTYIAANGCDSVRTLYLTVNPEDCVIPTINPSFENYTTSGGIYPTDIIDNTVPGWLTTESDHEIEVWRVPNYENVPSYDGLQFVELNANAPSGLYQDYSTPFPIIFTFTYAHRGRWGTDVAGVYAGPPGGPYTLLQTATDGNTAWGLHTGSYYVPAGQPITRFIFKAISSATGDPSVGNFLDDVNFTANNSLLSDSVTMNCLSGSFTAVSAGVGNWVALASNPSPTNISNPTGNNTIINGFGVVGIYKYTWQNASCIDTLVITANNNPVPVTPTFPEIGSFCKGTPSLVLPKVSIEGISGTWSPAIIDNTTSGTYTFTPDPGQCPATTTTLNVTILQPSASTINDTIPQGGSYDGHTTAGTYIDTLVAANGCDSIRTLNLVVNPVDCFIPTVNPSFETPLAPPGANWFFNDAVVPGWKTTEPDHMIEVWSSGFLGVPAYDGNQFVELNANAPSGLYQDYNTPTPLTFNFSYAHRGRAGVDVAGVYAGPPSGPYTLLQTATDGNTAWGFHTGSYTVPAGQPVTRFIFQAISENGLTGPNVSVGNFLDDVNFTAQNALLSDSATMNCLTGNFSAVSAGVGNWTAVGSNPSPTNISNPTGNNTIINGFQFTGVYKYTWKNSSCIDTLVINVNNNPVPVTPTFPEITSFCNGTPSLVLPAVSTEGISGTWSPATIDNTTSGTYTFTPNPGQCPANNATLNIIILQPSASITSDTVCASALPFTWNNNTYSAAGTYVDTFQNSAGCDSIATLVLTVSNTVTPTFSFPTSFCNGTAAPILPNTSDNSITGAWSPAILIIQQPAIIHLHLLQANVQQRGGILQ